MTSNHHDVIVVGARCAGSPTAMLLARQGYRVLLVDRATFPSDTISTHVIHPTGIAALNRWGLLGQLLSTGCPPVGTYAFDFGAFTIAGSPGTEDSPVGYAPRRTVLDQLLVDAAASAGAEVRQGFTVQEVLTDGGRVTGIRGRGQGGHVVSEHARMVIGADGLHSTIAAAVRPPHYRDKPPLLCAYYAYWSGLPMAGRFENYIRPHRGWAACPTHDGLTVVVVGWPHAEFAANKTDIEGNYLRIFDLAPDFAGRIRAASRETRIVGSTVPNYFRQPYGPGWALVGDAGYNKDPITAQGISDAFQDAERCATAVDQALSGTRSFGEAMSHYQATRDEHALPMYEFTTQLATLQPPTDELRLLLAAVHGNQEAMDGFARTNAGVMSPADFFSDENTGRVFAASRAVAVP